MAGPGSQKHCKPEGKGITIDSVLIPYLHTASIVLGFGHPDVKASLLACGIMLGLGHVAIKGGNLISVVEGQLVKGGLHITSGQLSLGHLALKLGLLVGSIQRSLGHLVAEAGLLIGCSHCGSYCTGLLIGVVHSELIKGVLRKGVRE